MEVDIQINRLNSFYIQLILKYNKKVEISRNLSQYFSQYSPNYLYDIRYKKRIWDGKIRFYDSRNSLLPIGLLTELKKFCKIFEYNYTVDESLSINNFKDLNSKEIESFIINFVEKVCVNPNYKIRNYQYKYLAKFIKNNTELLESPTASGKSLIIYLCIRYALNLITKGKKVLLIVPTIQLVEQMFKDFIDYGFDSEKYCARIYSGSEDQKLKLQTNKPIIISTWQSLYKLPENEFENIEMIVGDEIHEFGAVKAKSVLTNCKNAIFKLGTTATLGTDICSSWTIKGLFDEPVKYVSTMGLVEKKYISNFEVNIINLIYNEEYCKTAKNFSYFEEMDYLNSLDEKLDFIVQLSKKIIDKKENILILFKSIEYGKKIREKIVEELKIEPFYVDGSIKISDRETVRKEMELKDSQIAVCSFGTFSRGINIKNLQNLIFSNTTKAEKKILQSIGRVLRLHKNKELAKIWDIVDNLQYKKNLNYAVKHFYERKEIYERNEYKIKYFDINVK
jgi:superfamily II DNA or RNA helicase